MPLKSNTSILKTTFNKHGLYLKWPRVWIIVLGSLLIFICFCIAGMEVGHTMFDLYRSTAFGGLIAFIPLIICSIFILITACKHNLILLRFTIVLCWMMILLCMALIAYDILVIIDPTRCFLLNCDYASVNISNSTNNIVVTGWPLYISWPSYFQTNMNAKRIFQSIQICCTSLYILLVSLYLLTYSIYRNIELNERINHDIYRRQVSASSDTHRVTPMNYADSLSRSYNPYRFVTTYSIEGERYSSSAAAGSGSITSAPKRTSTFLRAKPISAYSDRLCARCRQEPRMTLKTNYERKNFFPYLCMTCNDELTTHLRKSMFDQPHLNPVWKP